MLALRALLYFSMLGAVALAGCAELSPAGHPRLSEELSAIAASIDARVGAGVIELDAGQTTLVRGTDRFPMHSVYKLPIAMAVLHAVDQGRMSLD